MSISELFQQICRICFERSILYINENSENQCNILKLDEDRNSKKNLFEIVSSLNGFIMIRRKSFGGN